ncbi:MAG: hypothetical protein PHO01_07075 [Desulfotomaculaceae bacterium]|nr:hypothetical protein [Desulfotomaculaceae bacterium]
MGIKYKLVIVLFLFTVFMGITVITFNFNLIVAPSSPVAAFRCENPESGAYHLELLGESMVVEWPVVNNPAGFISERAAFFREETKIILHEFLFKIF